METKEINQEEEIIGEKERKFKTTEEATKTKRQSQSQRQLNRGHLEE